MDLKSKNILKSVTITKQNHLKAWDSLIEYSSEQSIRKWQCSLTDQIQPACLTHHQLNGQRLLTAICARNDMKKKKRQSEVIQYKGQEHSGDSPEAEEGTRPLFRACHLPDLWLGAGCVTVFCLFKDIFI